MVVHLVALKVLKIVRLKDRALEYAFILDLAGQNKL